MSDSPSTLRSIGRALAQHSYWVVGLRLPGHGTTPSGIRNVTWPDMAAAVRLAMEHLAGELGARPIHMVGFSTGGALALDFALEEEGNASPIPASLVLISPAIRIQPFSCFISSPEVIRLTVMMYVRYPLWRRQVEDPLFERGIDYLP
jgi:alpha-beta hydrolase superfamily lysophospholipase